MPRTYTDDERETALALIRSGMSQREVAAQTGIPLSTLNVWHVRAIEATDASDAKETDYAALWGHAGRLAAVLVASQLEKAMESGEQLPAKDVRDLAVAGGIASDKHLDYRDGRKGTQINIDQRSLTLPPGLTADELRAIAFQPQIGEPEPST